MYLGPSGDCKFTTSVKTWPSRTLAEFRGSGFRRLHFDLSFRAAPPPAPARNRPGVNGPYFHISARRGRGPGGPMRGRAAAPRGFRPAGDARISESARISLKYGQEYGIIRSRRRTSERAAAAGRGPRVARFFKKDSCTKVVDALVQL